MSRTLLLALVAAILDGLAAGCAAALPRTVRLFFRLEPQTLALQPGGACATVPTGGGPVHLLLDSQDVYDVSLPLPTGAGVNGWAVVEMQAHRLMPLRPEFLAWDLVIAQGQAHIFMTRPDVLDAAEGSGMAINAITALHPNVSPQFLRLRPKRLRQRALRLVGLALALWIMLPIPLLGTLWFVDHQTALIEMELASLAGEVQHVQQLRDHVAFLGRDMDRTGALLAQPLRRQLLDEVARLLPDDAWLQELTINPEGLLLRGQSADATALLARFREGTVFTDVHFTTPITRNPAGGEDFTLVLSLVSSRRTP